MKLYGAIDLHSNNNVTVLIDEQDQVVYQKRLANDLSLIGEQRSPYASSLEGIVVESTYNWYWLLDGLMGKGHRVHLANTAAIQQYNGLNIPMTIPTRGGWRMCCVWECCPRAISIRNKSGRCAIFCAREANWSDKRPPIC